MLLARLDLELLCSMLLLKSEGARGDLVSLPWSGPDSDREEDEKLDLYAREYQVDFE